MGIVSEIETALARLREKESGDDAPVLRASTMTHLVWAPHRWLPRAHATLAGLQDRHPARTIFLVPEPARATGVTFHVSLHAVQVDETREAFAEVIEIRLRGRAVAQPASLVLPLLISDLPVFCRWRGEPAWGSTQLDQLVEITDRLVVNSSEWPGVPRQYRDLATLFERTAVSDIAFSRTLHWRARLAEQWPRIKTIERLRIEGPHADALLVAAWLRSRLKREISLVRRPADEIRSVRVDGIEVPPPVSQPAGAADLLSAELDVYGRDPIYEAAATVAAPTQG
jgi:glucose-6-phosphate dehydrogenase assembly protein OpcA